MTAYKNIPLTVEEIDAVLGLLKYAERDDLINIKKVMQDAKRT